MEIGKKKKQKLFIKGLKALFLKSQLFIEIIFISKYIGESVHSHRARFFGISVDATAFQKQWL